MPGKPQPRIAKRRYYLHRRAKQFATIRAHRRLVEVPAGYEPTGKQAEYLNELISYGYSVQISIPV